MTTHLAVCSFPYFTGLPEDVVVNTWHFRWVAGAPAEGDFGNLRDDLAQFYSTIYAAVGPLLHAPWLKPLLNTLTIYDLADPTPRPPVYEGSMALAGIAATANSTAVPEASICLSYKADSIPGVNPARTRGRVFLGGLGSPVLGGTPTTFPNVDAPRRTWIADAAEALLNSTGVDSWLWVVHSSTSAGDSAVTGGWVDDEPDTQRRRGRGATARTVWP